MTGRAMPSRLVVLSMVLALVSCSSSQEAHQEPAASPATIHERHWTYTGDTGPAAWGSLSLENLACAEGSSQSPIDIVSTAATSAPGSLAIQYRPTSLSIDHHEHITGVLDNGHTIQVNCAGAGSLTIDGKSYELVQFHFHSPSEHTVDGKSFPMELHVVHRSADDSLAVIGTLIEEGRNNRAFDTLWAHLPEKEGQEVRLPDVIVNVDNLLPANHACYRYAGSLTTPPCSEGVKWLVMKKPIALSSGQIAKFRAIFHDNHRPTQPLNGRAVALGNLAGAR